MIKPETYRAIVSGQRNDLAAICLRGCLAVAEIPYSFAVWTRNQFFDRKVLASHRVSVPVISVGNMTLGGTGKTPLVAWLARWFRSRQIRVSLISRGYGAATSRGNDEFKELASRLPDVPHLQDPDRVAAAHVAIDELETQAIILDDAFQHRRIERDLDMVLIDATEPFGFDHVFPRGTLREPLAGLARADIVALTRCDLVSVEKRAALRRQLTAYAPHAIWLEIIQRPQSLLSASGTTCELHDIPAGPILVFCGIGNPSAFRAMLSQLDWSVEDFREFPDHHAFDAQTLEDLSAWVAAHQQARAVICTHKDLVKIDVDRLGQLPLFALTIEIEIQVGQLELEARLQNLVSQIAS